MAARLRQLYEQEVRPRLMETLGISNTLAVPRLVKVCINMGVGRAVSENNPKLLENAQREMTVIAGQRAVLTRARKSVSTYKTRTGYPIGVRVTLRGERMYEFVDRLINVAMPRIRDFRGYSIKSFDGHGNYSLGVEEQTIFPEVDPDKVESVQGMDITIVTTAETDEPAVALLAGFTFPFRDGPFALTTRSVA